MDQGPLDLVMRMSRIVGEAPFTLTPELKISRNLAKCGIIFNIINGLLVVFLVADNFYLSIVNEQLISANQLIFSFAIVLLVITNMLGSFTAPRRLTRMAVCMKKLLQLDKKLYKRSQKNKANNKIVILITGFFIFQSTDILLKWIIFPNLFLATKLLQALLTLNMYVSMLLQLQIIFFARRVNTSLVSVNYNLQRLIFTNNNGASGISTNVIKHRTVNKIGRNVKISVGSNKMTCKPLSMDMKAIVSSFRLDNKKDIPHKIRELATHYGFICEIVQKTSGEDGAIILLSYLFFSIYIVVNIFLAFAIGVSGLSMSFIVYHLVAFATYAVCCIFFIVFYIEQFHQTHCEMEQTYNLITSRKFTEDEVELEHELELFSRMLILNNIKYSPLDMCTIDRTLTIKLFSGLITYLVITLQYGPETQKLFHVNTTRLATNNSSI